MRRRSAPGFSLIELFVVIAIVSIVLAIAVPGLGHVRRQAIRTECLASLGSFGTAMAMYRNANDGLLPEASALPDLPSGQTGLIDSLGSYLGAPEPHLSSEGVVIASKPYACPADETVASRYGMSYEYEFGTYLDVLRIDGIPNPLRRASLRTLEDPGMVLMADASDMVRPPADDRPWHPRASGETRNALYADGHADWLDRSDARPGG